MCHLIQDGRRGKVKYGRGPWGQIGVKFYFWPKVVMVHVSYQIEGIEETIALVQFY